MHIGSDMCINLAFMLPSVHTALRFDCTVSKIHEVPPRLSTDKKIKKIKKKKKTNIATSLSVAEIWAYRDAQNTKHSHRHRDRRTSLRYITSTTSRTDSCSADRSKYRRLTARSLNEDERLSGNAARAGDVRCLALSRGSCAVHVYAWTNHALVVVPIFVVTRRYRARRMYTYIRICDIRQER